MNMTIKFTEVINLTPFNHERYFEDVKSYKIENEFCIVETKYNTLHIKVSLINSIETFEAIS